MFFPSLARRHCQPEIMDRPDLDPGQHAQALRGLERINRFSASDRILWKPIAALARATPGRPLRVLDIATGGGDVPLRLWRRARRAAVPIELCGADVSRTAVEYAGQRTRQQGASIAFIQLDALRDELPTDFDVLSCSLFLHHLSDEQAVLLLHKMAQAAKTLVLVSDLRRGRAGYLVAWTGTRLLSRSPIVHSDGPVSVAAAFTCVEARALAERAGLDGATVARHWPWRWLLTWRRPV